jgi:hypothetical protein
MAAGGHAHEGGDGTGRDPDRTGPADRGGCQRTAAPDQATHTQARVRSTHQAQHSQQGPACLISPGGVVGHCKPLYVCGIKGLQLGTCSFQGHLCCRTHPANKHKKPNSKQQATIQ